MNKDVKTWSQQYQNSRQSATDPGTIPPWMQKNTSYVGRLSSPHTPTTGLPNHGKVFRVHKHGEDHTTQDDAGGRRESTSSRLWNHPMWQPLGFRCGSFEWHGPRPWPRYHGRIPDGLQAPGTIQGAIARFQLGRMSCQVAPISRTVVLCAVLYGLRH